MSNDGDKGSNSGGRTDAGPNRTTAYKAGVGNINEKGKKTGTYKSDNPDAFRNVGATKIKKGIKGPPSVQIVGNILSGPLQAGSKITRDFFTDKVIGSKNFKGMNKTSFLSMDSTKQEEIYGEYMSNRMSGKTDAYGNPTGGWRQENVKHKNKDGTYTTKSVWMGGNDNDNKVEKSTFQLEQENAAADAKKDQANEEQADYSKKKRLSVKSSRSLFANEGGRGFFN